MQRNRKWSITINGDITAWWQYICARDYSDEYQWFIAQKEQVTRLHIQAAACFTSVKSFKQVQERYPGAHIEIARDPKALWDYCQKSQSRVEEPFIFGSGPIQGKRNDLDDVYEAIKGGAELGDIIATYPTVYIKYRNGIEAVWKHHNLKPREHKPVVRWLYGLAGVGKTRRAIEYAEGSYYIKDGTRWWDNYHGEKTIIIDDFDGMWPFRDLLRLLDRYRYQGQYKGGYCWISAEAITITCEFPPMEYWEDNELAQVMRRIDVVERIDMVVDDIVDFRDDS